MEQYASIVLKAIVEHMGNSQENVDIRYSATNAFQNSLEFIGANFERDDDRNYIMTGELDTSRVCG